MTLVAFVQNHLADFIAFGYALAVFGSHVFPENTVAYKACRYVLNGKQL